MSSPTSESAIRRAPSCWVVTEGKAGMETPCLGLAEALGVEPTVKRIALRWPWRWIPPGLSFRPLAGLSAEGDRLDPPWPDLILANGRKAMAPSAAIRRRSKGRTKVIALQAPQMDPRHFDLVVAPAHDRVAGDNVIETLGSLTLVTPARLAAARKRFAPRYSALPTPRVAVLVGGHSNAHRLTEAAARALASNLRRVHAQHGAGLMVTFSRRTPAAAKAILLDTLADLPCETWNGDGENPYYGILAFADSIVVTEDSVNMISEAATTGKPVFIAEIEGGSAKFGQFRDSLEKRGIARPFTGALGGGVVPPLDESKRVAQLIQSKLAN